MKKLLSLCVLGMFAAAIGAAAQTNAVIDAESRIAEISGISAVKNECVSVIVTKPSADIQSITEENLVQSSVIIYELETAEDGSFSLQFRLPEEAVSGTYHVYISGEEESAAFYYASKAEMLEAAEAVNGADEENIGGVLKKYTVEKEVLGLDLSGDYAKLSSAADAAMVREVKAAAPQTVAEIKKCFEKALDTARFVCGDASMAESALKRNLLELNIDEKAETKELAAMYVLIRNTADASAIQHTVLTACALVRINSTTKGEMTQVLEEYNDILNLDLDGKYKTLDKVEVNKALVGKNFTSVEKVGEAFEKSVAAVSSAGKPAGGRGSSGGGGGSVTTALEVTKPVTGGNASQPQENPQPSEKLFVDLDIEPWAEEYIVSLAEKGIVHGMGNGIFAPQEYVTREEFLKMLIGAFGINCKENTAAFDDVEEGSWYAPYIGCGVNMGIVNGIDERHFGTGESITREQMAVMAVRMLEKRNITLEEGETDFTDAGDISEYAKAAVGTMQKAGIINGTPDGSFKPKEYSNRAQAAKVIYLVMKAGEGGV